MRRFELLLRSPEHTTAFAASFGSELGPGDCVLLSGGLGAGKTHFARALIQSRLPVPEDVPSPTFTLVQVYDLGGVELWHADLYRLSDAGDVYELGLADAFDTAICLVEWPDRLGQDRPEGGLDMGLEMTPTQGERVLTVQDPSPRWAQILEQAAHESA